MRRAGHGPTICRFDCVGVYLRSDASTRFVRVLTSLAVRNLKCLSEMEIPLGESTILRGPNDSGKTTAMQALTLWSLGAKRWHEKHGDRLVPVARSGVTVNRLDLVFLPVPHARMLWYDQAVRDRSNWVHVEVMVGGVTDGREWQCCLDFDFAHSELLYCRPMASGDGSTTRTAVPSVASLLRVVYIPPLSGLVANEVLLSDGAVNVRLGEGRSAELLRNVCYRLHQSSPQGWAEVAAAIEELFHAQIEEPRYVPSRGEVSMSYRQDRVLLDITCAGRGVRQALFLMACARAYPNSVLLMDDIDTHLDPSRQIEVYRAVKSLARRAGSQIIASGNSGVLLDAAERDGDPIVVFRRRDADTDDSVARAFPMSHRSPILPVTEG